MYFCHTHTLIMCLLISQGRKTHNRGLVYPINACFMKTVLKSPSWIVEIDRDLKQTLNFFAYIPSYIVMVHRIKIVLQKKWAHCVITTVQSSQNQTILSACKMILISWEKFSPAVVHRHYNVIVPKPYGVNFTVITLQTRYSGV